MKAFIIDSLVLVWLFTPWFDLSSMKIQNHQKLCVRAALALHRPLEFHACFFREHVHVEQRRLVLPESRIGTPVICCRESALPHPPAPPAPPGWRNSRNRSLHSARRADVSQVPRLMRTRSLTCCTCL